MKLDYKADRPLIMGILNVTPDSFSDGGEALEKDRAVEKVKRMITDGADIIDIGGQSTGPGSVDVDTKTESERVIPVLKEVRRFSDIPISIDTFNSQVAKEALENGADLINDVTAFRTDPKILNTVIKNRCPYIIMYSKDDSPRTTVAEAEYNDVVVEINSFLEERIKTARSSGVSKKQIIIDPGLGQFISSNPKYSYEIIARLSEFKVHGLPILIGASRKSFLMGPMNSRDPKGVVVSAIAYLSGASIIRTHDVKNTKMLFDNF